VEHLPGYALADLAKVAPLTLVQAEFAVQFTEKIAEKRAVYGLSDPAAHQEEEV